MPFLIDRAPIRADSAPAAPIMCPVIDLGAVIEILSAKCRSDSRMARVSALSLAWVEVPCATIMSMSAGLSLLRSIARVMAWLAYLPDGSGATMLKPSLVSAPPSTSA